jgi:hypothetical protein
VAPRLNPGGIQPIAALLGHVRGPARGGNGVNEKQAATHQHRAAMRGWANGIRL